MCSVDCNLKNELLPVCAGVIQGQSVLLHIHVELGHTILQVLVQLCDLDSKLLRGGLRPLFFFLLTAQWENISSPKIPIWANNRHRVLKHPDIRINVLLCTARAGRMMIKMNSCGSSLYLSDPLDLNEVLFSPVQLVLTGEGSKGTETLDFKRKCITCSKQKFSLKV